MQLNELKDKDGATKARKRVGRGVGSGLGKTAGRGQKGQKSRSGVAINGFEGGQNPLHMRLPKRGFKNLFRRNFSQINLDQLQTAIDQGKIESGQTVDAKALLSAGLIRRELDGVRLLGRGELKAKVCLEIAGASQSAAKAVEAAGGSIKIIAPVPETDADRADKKGKKKSAKQS